MKMENIKETEGFIQAVGVANIPFQERLTPEQEEEILGQFAEARCREMDKSAPLSWVPRQAAALRYNKNDPARDSLEAMNQYRVGKPYSSYLEAFADVHGQRPHEGAVRLIAELGYDNLLHDYHVAQRKLQTVSGNRFRPRYWPERLVLFGSTYKPSGYTPIETPVGDVAGAVMRYQDESGREILIPGQVAAERHPKFSTEEYYLEPGSAALGQYLLHESELARKETSTVFMCDDLRVCPALAGLIKDSKRSDLGCHVATAVPGGRKSLEHCDLSGVRGKHVVYIPAPARASYAAALEYGEKCLKAGAASFKVLCSPVLLRPLTTAGEGFDSLADPWERHVAKHAVVLPREESQVLYRLAESAWDLEIFKDWGAHCGLFTVESVPQQTEAVSGALNGGELLEAPLNDAATKGKASLECFSSARKIGVILAPKNAGKTQMGVTVSLAGATGVGVFDLSALPPKKTFYVDSEAGKDQLAKIVQRIVPAYGMSRSLVQANFFWRSFRDENHGRQVDLTDPYFQNLIEKDLRSNGATFIVFDNLVGLVPGIRGNGGKKWKLFFEWLARLERDYGVSVLILHHTNGEMDAAGSRDIEVQCHNVFLLEGREQLQKNEASNPVFAPYLQQKGALLRVTVKKCKDFPELEYSPFGLFLAYDEAKPTSGPGWERFSIEAQAKPSQVQTMPAETLPPKEWSGKSNEETRILSHIAQAGHATRRNIEALLECKDTKAGDLLRALVHDGLLALVGAGKSARYILCE